jgi:hypothetical protein
MLRIVLEKPPPAWISAYQNVLSGKTPGAFSLAECSTGKAPSNPIEITVIETTFSESR